MEHIVTRVSQSSLATTVRRLVGQSTLGSRHGGSSVGKQDHYKPSDDMELPLQERAGSSSSNFKPRDLIFVDKTQGSERGRNDVQVTRTYQVV